jgi:hypothetical protein
MSISITGAMERTTAAEYISRTCRIAIDAVYAMLNTATIVRRVTLDEHRVTISAAPSLNGWAYRISQAIG